MASVPVCSGGGAMAMLAVLLQFGSVFQLHQAAPTPKTTAWRQGVRECRML